MRETLVFLRVRVMYTYADDPQYGEFYLAPAVEADGVQPPAKTKIYAESGSTKMLNIVKPGTCATSCSMRGSRKGRVGILEDYLMLNERSAVLRKSATAATITFRQATRTLMTISVS